MNLEIDDENHTAEFKYVSPIGPFTITLYDPLIHGKERWQKFADNMRDQTMDMVVFLNDGHSQGDDEVTMTTVNGSFEFSVDNGRIGGAAFDMRIPNAYEMFLPMLEKILAMQHDPSEYDWLDRK